MAMLQGSTYRLPIKIVDGCGRVLTGAMVERAVFTFNEDIAKHSDMGEVYFDNEKQVWVVGISESDSFSFSKVMKWQARFVLSNGEIVGTIPKSELVYASMQKIELDKESDDVE